MLACHFIKVHTSVLFCFSFKSKPVSKVKQVQGPKLVNFYSIFVIRIHVIPEYSKRHFGEICKIHALPGRDLARQVLAWAAFLQLSYKPLKNRIYNGNADTTLTIARLRAPL